LLIESSDRLFGDGAIGVVDKSETAWTSGFPISGEHDLRWRPDTRQMLAQIRLGRGIR